MFSKPRLIAKEMNTMDLGKSDKVCADGNFQYKTLLGKYLSKSISVKKKVVGKRHNMHILSGIVLWFQYNIVVKDFF